MIIAEDIVNLRQDRKNTVGINIENILLSTGLEALDKRTF